MTEQLYDEKIAPLLLEAAQLCQDNNISLVCLAEFAPNETGLTVTLTGRQGIETTMTYYAAQSKGNADILISNLAKHGKEYGHNSMFLEMHSRMEQESKG